MSTKTSAELSSIDTSGATTSTPAVEADRFARAVREDMITEAIAPRLYRVTNDEGEGYDVDVVTGACSCPDATYRSEQYVCKHALRASLVETFANTVSSEL